MASQRADARQNREHLVQVARQMAKSGEVPSFNALARAAKVGVGTVYRHFEDERALVTALAAEPLAAYTATLEATGSTEDPGTALASAFTQTVALVMHHPMVAKLFLLSPSALRPFEKRLAAMVERAQRAGHLRAPLTLDDFHRLVCGIEVAATMGPQPDEAAARYTELVLRGLLGPPLAPRPKRTSKAT